MRFFTDEENDFEGYLEQLTFLRGRLSEEVYTFFSTDSFHDAHIYSLNVINKFHPNSGGKENNPTYIKAHLLHSSGTEYIVYWKGVNKFLMDYDINRNTYVDSDEIVCDGQRGLDDWMVDEITSYDDHYLSHEVILASDTKLHIRFTSIEMKKI